MPGKDIVRPNTQPAERTVPNIQDEPENHIQLTGCEPRSSAQRKAP